VVNSSLCMGQTSGSLTRCRFEIQLAFNQVSFFLPIFVSRIQFMQGLWFECSSDIKSLQGIGCEFRSGDSKFSAFICVSFVGPLMGLNLEFTVSIDRIKDML